MSLNTPDAIWAKVSSADPNRSADEICQLADEHFEDIAGTIPPDGAALQVIIQAACSLGRFDLLTRLALRLADKPEHWHVTKETASLLHHLTLIAEWPAATTILHKASSDGHRGFAEIISATSEVRFLRALDKIDISSSTWLSHIVLLIALARQLRWHAGFRRAQYLLICGITPDRLAELPQLWQALDLPMTALPSIKAHVSRKWRGPELDEDWRRCLNIFREDPTIETAQVVWQTADLHGRTGPLLVAAPLSGAARSALAGRMAATIPANASPIWIYMTWREGADQLIGAVCGYLDVNSRITISVGGDGGSADLQRASAALLATRLYMFARPVVTWGGAKLFFQNLLPVVEAFNEQTVGTAWLSIVCDRSFPLHGIAHFAHRLADKHIMSRPGLLDAPHSWHREWEDEIVQTLPARLSSALNELFSRGTAKHLIDLVGPDSSYFPPNDFRLNQCHVNFGGSPRAVQGEKRFAAQSYAISAYNVDFRWMSVARLAEFVDVGTEVGTTFARALHPWIVEWIHETLKPLNTRIGEPFFVADRRYTMHLLANPDRFRLFAAMSFGMGPEMNFFDTYAWSNDLVDHFLHLFARQPMEEVDSKLLDAVLEDADSTGHQYVRKAVRDPYDQLLNTLARRLIDDAGWSDIYWAIPGPKVTTMPDQILPALDAHLMDVLVGLPLVVRDLLGRRVQKGSLTPDGEVRGPEGTYGRWRYAEGWLLIDFDDPQLGTKRYTGIGANATTLTLVPDEIVDVYNGWSAFLDFDLAAIDVSERIIVQLNPDTIIGHDLLWIGGTQQEACLLAAFADLGRSVPTPTLRYAGRALEFRSGSRGSLLLATVNGWPALLRLRGAAHANGRTVIQTSSADDEDHESWASAQGIQPSYTLSTLDLRGRWKAETFSGQHLIELRNDGSIRDEEGVVLGRWLAREGSLTLVGLDKLRIAVATQFQVFDGLWRLTGWARPNLQETLSFSLSQIQRPDRE
ncbi:hypothetical protein [Sphingomonas sp.]|uniref:hypothetical protein n=1 Tax=Sphingomonas sp. TaxID=28214 RepID=UPI0025E4A122|nr:hypothetical protein [Sphingomonas sp.]